MRRVLSEIKRMDMIDRTKGLSQARYDRRLNYSAKIVHKVGPQELSESGNFSLLFEIGDYKSIVEFRGMRDLLMSEVKKGNYSRSKVQNIMTKAVDSLDLGVYCTCADFFYRFHYLVTMEDSLPSGSPKQIIPAEVRNPNNEGFLCKHLSAILSSPSKWMPKAVTLLRESIKYMEEVEGYEFSEM